MVVKNHDLKQGPAREISKAIKIRRQAQALREERRVPWYSKRSIHSVIVSKENRRHDDCDATIPPSQSGTTQGAAGIGGAVPISAMNEPRTPPAASRVEGRRVLVVLEKRLMR